MIQYDPPTFDSLHDKNLGAPLPRLPLTLRVSTGYSASRNAVLESPEAWQDRNINFCLRTIKEVVGWPIGLRPISFEHGLKAFSELTHRSIVLLASTMQLAALDIPLYYIVI